MVAAIAGVATVAGAAMSADAAGDAAAGQQAATQQSNAMQQAQYENNVRLQMPTINTGNAARDRLSMLLGLSPTGFSNSTRTINGMQTGLTRDKVREQLLAQYTRSVPGANAPLSPNPPNPDDYASQAAYAAARDKWFGATTQQQNALNDPNNGRQFNAGEGGYFATGSTLPGGLANTDQIDEAGLSAAIDDYYRQQQAWQDEAAKNPEFGSLSDKFQFNTYTPDKFSYTGEDLYDDPSYQWRLSQGQKALDRSGAAAGRFLSGRQLQAASDYNQGAASQEFQSAYQRALGTFGTNEGNRANAFNTNEGNRFNAYQANFNNAVNPLLSLAGAATLGSQNLGAAGATAASTMGNALTNQANATGAAGIASANSISNGLNGAVSSYQSNNMLNSLLNRNTGVNNNPSSSSSLLPNAAAYDFTRD